MFFLLILMLVFVILGGVMVDKLINMEKVLIIVGRKLFLIIGKMLNILKYYRI